MNTENNESATIDIKSSDPTAANAISLTDELSECLTTITGRDGRDSFSSSEITNLRSLFFIAYQDEKAVGCGALRPIDNDTCEIKRMYARHQSKGIGKSILTALEEGARNLGFLRIVLETGIQNKIAIKFYLRNGYVACENYGKYQGRPECVCFDKAIRE